MSQFDRENLERILEGYGDWYGALLLRTIAMGNVIERALLFMGYPQEVQAIANIDHKPFTHPLGGSPEFEAALDRLWIKADAENRRKLARCFSRFDHM